MENSCSIPVSVRTTTVAELAIAHPGALSVFNKYNIDYCCGGHRSIEEACMHKGLDPETIKKEIREATSSSGSHALRPETWTSSFLIDYIIEVHHGYVRRALPEILALLDKVCDVHGTDSPELLQIREIFLDLSLELTNHMTKEETFLFPALKRLEAQAHPRHPLFDSVLAPISVMMHEHDAAGDQLKAIRSLADNYSPPDFACPTYMITFKKLQEFDEDLMRHIHLENNILFRKNGVPVDSL